MLEDIIYKIDAQRNVSELARGLRFPSSLAVDSLGNLFYTTSPLEDSYPATLYMLNPEDRTTTELHTFDVKYKKGIGLMANVEYEGKKYKLPVGFNVSNVLYETKEKIDFLFTNSYEGNLIKLSADKD